MPDFLVHAFRWLSGFLQGHPPIAGVVLSLLVFFSAYQHFDVRDSKGGRFFQGLAGLILILFAVYAIFSGMWLSLILIAGALFVEVWLALRHWHRSQEEDKKTSKMNART
jgi:hypothetical protein